MRLDHLLSKDGEVGGCIAVEVRRRLKQGRACKGKSLAAIRPGGTRVPTPNTKVKARAADGTVLGTAWESRRLPDIKM